MLGISAKRDWEEALDSAPYNPTHCGKNLTAFAGDDPVDYVFFEPALPAGAPVESSRIVWTTNLRHPASFALARTFVDEKHVRSAFHPEFALHSLAPSPRRRVGAHAWCAAPSARISELMRYCWQGPAADEARAGARDYDRSSLEAAKARLSHFSVVLMVEHYAQGLQAYCRRLRWPADACTLNGKPHLGSAQAAATRVETPAAARRRLRSCEDSHPAHLNHLCGHGKTPQPVREPKRGRVDAAEYPRGIPRRCCDPVGGISAWGWTSRGVHATELPLT